MLDPACRARVYLRRWFLHVSDRRRESGPFLLSIALLLFGVSSPRAQTLNPVPGFLQDVTGQTPLRPRAALNKRSKPVCRETSPPETHSLIGMGLQFRQWFHYDGFPYTTLTGGVTYISYFTVLGTSYHRHPEWRFTLMGTVKQPLRGGSLYEQIRGELLNFRDSHGAVQRLPRVRFRFGQNLYLGEGGP